MNDLFLIKPNKEYKNSFEDYVSTYKRINDSHYFNKYKKALENFSDYLDDIYNYSNGINLPQGEAITSTFWLINKNKVVGVIRIRHQEVEYAGHIGYDISPDYRNKGYGSEILKLALEKTEKIGIKEVVLTCTIDNIASKKIIEKNKGILLGTVFDEEEDEYLHKYIITSTNI